MKELIPLLIFLLCISSAFAYSVDSYDIDYHIAFRKVVVESEIDFNESITDELSIPLPSDAKAVELEIDDMVTEVVIEDNNLILKLDSNQDIKWSYISKDLLDRSDFLSNVVVLWDTNELDIKLHLPKHAILAVPLTDTTGSAYPRPTDLVTDGRTLVIKWLKNDVRQGDEMSLFVKYKLEKSSFLFYTILVLSIFIIIVLAVLLIKKKEKIRTIVRKEYVLEKHLKEDEEQVVNILKQREGKCEQGTLRVITGFSKAKLSGLLKELDERKIIHKEKRGKKNLVFLKT